MIQVDMVKRLEECMEIFGEDVSTLVTSPATKKFFEGREDAKQLSDKRRELFHLVVEKLLFIVKRSRPDLDTAVVFFITKVSNSGVDDWGKLRRILRFNHCTLREKDFWRN